MLLLISPTSFFNVATRRSCICSKPYFSKCYPEPGTSVTVLSRHFPCGHSEGPILYSEED